MDSVTNLLNVNVKKDGRECFVISRFVKRPASMDIVPIQDNAFVTLDGQAQIVIFASSSLVVQKMVTVPNLWSVFATMDMKVAFVTKPNVERVAIKQMVTVINQMNAGAMLAGLDLDAMNVLLILVAKMDAVKNHGNVIAKADIKGNYVIVNILNLILQSTIITRNLSQPM